MRGKGLWALRAALLLSVAVVAGVPALARDVQIAPAWSVRVVDMAGKPMAGIEVHEHWAFFGVDPMPDKETSLVTDAKGWVVFPARSFSSSEASLVAGRAEALLNVHGSYGPTAKVWIYPKGYKNIEASYGSDIFDQDGAKTRKGSGGLETVLQLTPIDILDSIQHEDWSAVKALILADKKMANFRSRERRLL